MSNFAYDGTTLPTGKSDSRPLTGRADQSVRAAEWNNVMQAVYDMRGALFDSVGKSVLLFGADPTGVADSSAAILAAINSFSAPGSSAGGVVLFPPGLAGAQATYRIAQNVPVKKQITFLSYGATIVADPGITPFTVERYNTPTGTTDAGAGDGSSFIGLNFYNPSHKVGVWQQSHAYTVGQRVKVGPAPGQGANLLGDNAYCHYECTTSGTSAASGTGPQSFGRDYNLNYTSQTGNFTRSQFNPAQNGGQVYVVGGTSSAEGFVVTDTDAGTTGTLRLSGVFPGFLNGEIITDGLGGSATVNGTATLAVDDELDGTCRWKYIGPGSAIKIRANGVVLRDVAIQAMSGSGIHMRAGDPECPAAFANANGWKFSNVDIATCDGHGTYVRGSDANGGKWEGGEVGGNGGAASDESYSGPGFNAFESSFLGNIYTGILYSTAAGQGTLYVQNSGGGSTFIGCYQEGTGGGDSVINNAVISGAGLATSVFKGSGAPSWNQSSVVAISATGGQGLRQTVRGFGEQSWRPSVFMPLGVRRSNGGNVYAVTVAGTTASSVGPTGTGTGIVDGTVHWDFVHANDPGDGFISFGSPDPSQPIFVGLQSPEDVGAGLTTDLKHTNSNIANDVHALQYGASGPAPSLTQGNGLGITHATNQTVMPEWPMKIPAGKLIVDQLWLGSCRHQWSTSTSDPSEGTWNAGDRMYYKGAAVTAGGFEGKICVTAGTAGTYSGGRTITGTGITTVTVSGAAMSTLVDQQDFHIGDWLVINGGSKKQVIGVSANGLSLVMSAAVSGGAGLSVAFSAPVFKTFGAISA